MGCGCKNKSNSTPQTQSNQQATPSTQTGPTNQTVQETIKKTIEKYYTVSKPKQ
jgi:hypothetical protein